MAQQEEVRIPDIGDAENVEVIELVAEPGATVEKDDPLIVLESDKASMDVPSPVAGKLVRYEVAIGDTVDTGTLFAIIERDEAGAGAGPREAEAERREPAAEAPAGEAPEAEEAEATEPEPQKAEKAEKGEKAEKAEKAGKAEEREKTEGAEKAGKPEKPEKAEAPEPAGTTDIAAGKGPEPEGREVYAGPAVRRFARELGVDLSEVKGSGEKGRVMKGDIAAHVKSALSGEAAAGAGIPRVPLPDFSRFGPTETVERSRVLIRGAENLARSWLNVPHVTHHDDADVTDLEAFRASLKPDAERRQVRLTPLPFVIKACIAALRAFPTFNASLSADGRELIVKRYYHVGIAVDTPQGLVVPVVRDADRKGIFDLAAELAEVSDRARDGKLKTEEMQGASFTVTSLGALGGRGFTPIINAPEVAILGVSKIDTRPVWDGASFQPCQMLPLSLSYDHRVINGADAGRFMVYLCEALRDLRRTML